MLKNSLGEEMMTIAQINISNMSFQYDTHGEDIFKNVSFCIDTDWKLGLVGRNGRGKTTFLKLLLGEYEYSGKITSPVQFEYFPIQITNKKQIALEVVRHAIAPFTLWEEQMEEALRETQEMERYGEILQQYIEHDGYTINEMIEKEVRKMGLDPDILERTFETLSCGEQTKLLLIALFLRKNYFLLIDEPTNHLDAEGREKVAEYLADKKGFILVSHDRSFLDKIINHVLSINKANIEIQKGNFSTWQLNKERQDEFEKAEYDKLQKDIKRLQTAARQKVGWSHQVEASKKGNGPCDRGFIGHKAAKMMKRAKCIETRQNKAIEEKSKLLKNLDTVEKLNLVAEEKQGEVLEIQNLQICYDQQVLFDALSFKFSQGDRVWLRGKNGCGKSSIIKLLVGEAIPHTGFVRKTNKISYISQDTSFLQGEVDEFARGEGIEIEQLKNVLYKLGIERSQFEKKIEAWSQGQKKKLLIAKSLCEKAELYIWDEPLNFIDVISRMQIEALILSKKPTMLFVEHDYSFGEKIATKIIEL